MKYYRLFTLVLTLVLACAFDNPTSAHDASLPLKISSVEDFLTFAEGVNSGEETFAQAEVSLTCDLDFTGVSFVPVGTADHPFSGAFDGCGHTLSGLNIKRVDNAYIKTTIALKNGKEQVSVSASVGVFGYLHNASVRNLDITGMTVDVTTDDTVCAGLLCGSFSADGEGRSFCVERCSAEGIVNAVSLGGATTVGGLVGSVYDTGKQVAICITDCYADANLTAKANNTVRCGGIVADLTVKKVFSTATLENLFSGGTLYGKGKMVCLGGICGFASVDNSWASGAVDWSTQIVPGSIQNIVTDVSAESAGTGSAFVGAVVGYTNTVSPQNAYAVTVFANSSYAFGGTMIERESLADSSFLEQILKWNMRRTWCVTEEGPALRRAQSPLAISEVKNENDLLLVTVRYDGAAQGVLICAAYRADGSMADVHMQSFCGEAVFPFANNADIAIFRAFLLDEATLRPLCACSQSVALPLSP